MGLSLAQEAVDGVRQRAGGNSMVGAIFVLHFVLPENAMNWWKMFCNSIPLLTFIIGYFVGRAS